MPSVMQIMWRILADVASSISFPLTIAGYMNVPPPAINVSIAACTSLTLLALVISQTTCVS